MFIKPVSMINPTPSQMKSHQKSYSSTVNHIDLLTLQNTTHLPKVTRMTQMAMTRPTTQTEVGMKVMKLKPKTIISCTLWMTALATIQTMPTPLTTRTRLLPNVNKPAYCNII